MAVCTECLDSRNRRLGLLEHPPHLCYTSFTVVELDMEFGRLWHGLEDVRERNSKVFRDTILIASVSIFVFVLILTFTVVALVSGFMAIGTKIPGADSVV